MELGKAEWIDPVLTHARGNLSARDAVEDEPNLPIHAKMTQAQSPVILMALQVN